MNPFSDFKIGQLLSDLTTFGIGGPARYFTEVRTIKEMQRALLLCREKKIPYFVLGKGSNTLFDDRGFNGLVIHNKIDFFERPNENTFYVGAGYSFSLLGTQTAREGWAGLEFASGIPGSVGGAVFMNAGANGSETADFLTSIDFITDSGERILLPREGLPFTYRSSPFQSLPGAIIGATFTLKKDPLARQRQIEIINYRKKTQPLNEKSAGCVFRNPSCGHAGALIEKSALKGTAVGGAQISEIHANFIINRENCSAEDVLKLIQNIRESVKSKMGITLESEIRFIPYSGAHND